MTPQLQSALDDLNACPDAAADGKGDEALVRRNANLCAAVRKEIDLLDYWADSIGPVRPAQAVRMRMRRDELRKILNPAAIPTPGVPSGMRRE